MSHRFVVLSGCSGGGKSTLLAELGLRGYSVVEEPGRRIVQGELACGGSALPWIDMAAFARRCIEVALADRRQAEQHSGWVFFDRSLIDACSALNELNDVWVAELGVQHRYNPKVFLAPPWREIFAADVERRHSFEEAAAEYDRLLMAYPALGYDVTILPKTSPHKRADFVLASLGG